MNIELYTDDIQQYLKCDDVIDYDAPIVSKLADTLFNAADNEIGFIQKAYEYVRDKIPHSVDIGENEMTCRASEVLRAGHGICFAKSHMLAALLRCKGIPAGFCYQKLILDDDTAPILVYHGLNGVYLQDYGKWIRLDARGNKPGVDARFSIHEEQLAFPIRPNKGEEDGTVIYPDPDTLVIRSMMNSKTRSELWNDLPAKLGYNMKMT